jgi:hypothetical protein
MNLKPAGWGCPDNNRMGWEVGDSSSGGSKEGRNVGSWLKLAILALIECEEEVFSEMVGYLQI